MLPPTSASVATTGSSTGLPNASLGCSVTVALVPAVSSMSAAPDSDELAPLTAAGETTTLLTGEPTMLAPYSVRLTAPRMTALVAPSALAVEVTTWKLYTAPLTATG